MLNAQQYGEMLDMIFKRQHCMLTKLYEQEQKIQKISEAIEEISKMFTACHAGFRQVRDACTCLREELSEAAGSMVVNQDYTD